MYGFNIGIYIITNIRKKESYLAKTYSDIMVKPCIGETLIIDNMFYKINTVTIDYEKNNIHVFVERIE